MAEAQHPRGPPVSGSHGTASLSLSTLGTEPRPTCCQGPTKQFHFNSFSNLEEKRIQQY